MPPFAAERQFDMPEIALAQYDFEDALKVLADLQTHLHEFVKV